MDGYEEARRGGREGEVSVVSALAVNRPHYTGNAHEVCLEMSEGREGGREKGIMAASPDNMTDGRKEGGREGRRKGR